MKKIYDIENSIEALKEWIEKHPDMSLSLKVKDEVFKDNKELKEEYDKMRKMYAYLRTEKSKKHMSDEQINRCKEANVGGVFGYSKKYEEYAEAWKCSVEDVAEILAPYGSIEELYNAYVTDEMEIKLPKYVYISNIFPFSHDIEMNNNMNYNILASAIKGRRGSNKELIYYSKSHLEEIINKALFERERQILKLRFGLEDGQTRSLEEVGKVFNVSRERIRCIEGKALRQLRYPKHRIITKLNLDVLTEEERQEILEANKKLSIIDTPQEEKERSNEVIKKYIERQNKIVQKEKEEKQELIKEELKVNPNYEFENMPIWDFIHDEDINMSERLTNCLGRTFGLRDKKVKDILTMNVNQIRKIRNLGNKTLQELLNILAAKDYILDEEGNFVRKETIKNNDESIKMVFNTPESIKKENDVLKREIEEKEQKAKLLDELISLFDEQEELKNKNSQLDEEIKQKLTILNQKGITYEKK